MIVNAPAEAAIEGWLRVAASNMHATRLLGQNRPLCPRGVDAGFGTCYAPQRVLVISPTVDSVDPPLSLFPQPHH